jgi:putative tricarboxylic transport membrane protein
VRLTEAAGAAVWLALGLWIVWEGQDLGLGRLNDPGSGFMLFWVGLLMTALASVQLVASLRLEAALPEGFWPPFRSLGRILLVVIGIEAFALAVTPIGFLPCAALLLFFLFVAIEGHRWWLAAPGALATAVAFDVVFRIWLGSSLPTGALWAS